MVDPKYLSAFLNSSYARGLLASKVVGAGRPMIRVTDVREMEIPKVSVQDMRDIGEAYMLSGKKQSLLHKMIAVENRLMENIVLESIKEGMKNGKES